MRTEEMHILIVEDAEDLAILYKRRLEKLFGDRDPLTIQVCQSIPEVVPALSSQRPQVILLDLHIPPYSADQIIDEFVLQFSRLAEVIICSSITDENIFRRAIMNGANDYIPKGLLFGSGPAEEVGKWLRSRILSAHYRTVRNRSLGGARERH